MRLTDRCVSASEVKLKRWATPGRTYPRGELLRKVVVALVALAEDGGGGGFVVLGVRLGEF